MAGSAKWISEPLAQKVASGSATAAASPERRSGSIPFAAARSYTSRVASMPTSASSAASTQPPTYAAATATGIATAEKATRWVIRSPGIRP